MSTTNNSPDSRPDHEAPDTSEQLEINDAPAQSAGGAPGPDEDLAGMLTEAQSQIANYHDQLLRAKAEVENTRRRAADDVAKARKFGIESFAESLVPVKDSLEAALSQPDQTADAWRAGVEATLKQLNGAFDRNLLKEVAPAAGEKFDPHVHQAISTIPSEFDEGAVVQLLQKGYMIAERVLRPALVIVSSGKGE